VHGVRLSKFTTPAADRRYPHAVHETPRVQQPPSSPLAGGLITGRRHRRAVRFAVLIGVLATALTVPLGTRTSATAREVPESQRVALTYLTSVYDHMGDTIQFQALSDGTPGPLPESIDLRLSRTPMRAPHMAAWTYPTETQQMSLTLGDAVAPPTNIDRGWIVCGASRPHYSDGVTGQWGLPFCTGRYVDDASLVRKGHVKRVANLKFWRGRASVVFGVHSSLTLRRVPAHSSIITLATVACSPKRVCKAAMLSIPTKTGSRALVVGSLVGRHTYYRQESAFANHTERLGPLIFRSSSDAGPSNPIEGILIYPPWTGF
jgi:hypothetical protein